MTDEEYQRTRGALLALPGPVDVTDEQAVRAELDRLTGEEEALRAAALRGGGEEAVAWAGHWKRRAWSTVHLAELRPDFAVDARAAVAAWQAAEDEVATTFLGQHLADRTEIWLGEQSDR